MESVSRTTATLICSINSRACRELEIFRIFRRRQYAMRLWVSLINSRSLASLCRTSSPQCKAEQRQSAGQSEGEPIPRGQKFTYTVRARVDCNAGGIR